MHGLCTIAAVEELKNPALAGQGRDPGRDQRRRAAAGVSARPVGDAQRSRLSRTPRGGPSDLRAEPSRDHPRRSRCDPSARRVVRPCRLSRRAVRPSRPRYAAPGRPLVWRHARLRDCRRDAGASDEARFDRPARPVAGRSAGQELDDPSRGPTSRGALCRPRRGCSGAVFRAPRRSGGSRRIISGLDLVTGLHREICLADPGQRSQEAHPPDSGADHHHLGE